MSNKRKFVEREIFISKSAIKKCPHSTMNAYIDKEQAVLDIGGKVHWSVVSGGYRFCARGPEVAVIKWFEKATHVQRHGDLTP